jgi:hypothetical protein
MTYEQACAILEAERVLQAVGRDGPDTHKGSAWYDYVECAFCVVADDPVFWDEFNDLHRF